MASTSSSKTARAASALKSGVVLGGTAIFSALNGYTPHMAGAIDIMVVEQPDGSLKCSPFYVRFGKYAPMRAKDKNVRISVNGEEAPFCMHLGAYGQAYFAAETTEIVSDADDDADADEDMLSGMMSPPSGYSSADEAGAPFANEAILSAVQAEVARLKRGGSGVGGGGGGGGGGGNEQAAAAVAAAAPGDGGEVATAKDGEKQQQQQQQTPPAAPVLKPAASLSSVAPGAGAGSARTGGGPSGSESSSELSDSSSEGDTATSSRKPAVQQDRSSAAAAALPPLPPHSPAAHGAGRRAHHVSRSTTEVRAAAAAAAVEATAVAAAAAKVAAAERLGGGLADGERAPLEDLLLDSKFAVEAADAGELERLRADRAAPGADRAQHTPAAIAAAARRESGALGSQSRSAGEDGDKAAAANQGSGEAAAGAATAAAAQLDVPQSTDALVEVASTGTPADSGKTDAAADSTAPVEEAASGAAKQSSAQSGGGSSSGGGLLAASLRAHNEAVAAAAAAAATAATSGEALAAAVAEPAAAAPAPAADEEEAPAAAVDVSVDGPASPQPASKPVDIAVSPAAQQPAQQQQQQQRGSSVPVGLSPSDAGYLADSEGPRAASVGGLPPALTAAPPPLLGAAPAAHSGAMALGGQGFQMSRCGHLLRAGMPPAEALQLFEAHAVSAAAWAAGARELLGEPALVVKVGGVLYPWSAAAPMVLGMLAFGGAWHDAAAPAAAAAAADGEAEGDAAAAAGVWHPLRVAEERAGGLPKKGGDADGTGGATPTAGSSWRLWPFSSWREGGSTGGASKPVVGATAVVSAIAGSAASLTGGGASPPHKGAGAAAADQGVRPGTSPPPISGLLSNLTLPLSRAGSFGGLSNGGGGGGASPRKSAAAAQSQQPQQQQQSPPPRRHIVIIRKTLMPTPEQLAALPLRFGANTISFRCSAGGSAPLTAYVYYYPWNARLVISDVDGTITRSDLLGHVLPPLGVDWSHAGITRLFHNIAANGYQIMFLSSRAISQANVTREYLHRLVQDGYKMPGGPVIISPHGLLPSLYREIVQRRPHEFKIACLEDIRALFPPEWNPFYAGFGNRDTDVISYREVGVPPARTFIINPKGQICKGSAFAVQSSTWSSLSAINALVDEVFPAVHEMLDIMRGRGPAGALRAAAAAVVAVERMRAGAGAGGFLSARSSLAGEGDGGGGGGPVGATASATLAAVAAAMAEAGAAAAGGDEQQQQQQQDGEQQQEQEQSQQQQQDQQQDQLDAVPLNSAAAPLRSSSAAAAPALASARSASSAGARSCARLVAPSAVGPQRDEFNDAQYWRPALAFDVDAELRAASASAAAAGGSGGGASRRASLA